MKHFQPKIMKPDTNQFFEAVKGKISDEGQKSLAYRAVYGLFEQAQSIYRKLAFLTNESISHFKASGKYPTQRQEQDAVALTVIYLRDLRTPLIHDLVKKDITINEAERQSLEMTFEIYKTT